MIDAKGREVYNKILKLKTQISKPKSKLETFTFLNLRFGFDWALGLGH